jgi:hypothetical protein
VQRLLQRHRTKIAVLAIVLGVVAALGFIRYVAGPDTDQERINTLQIMAAVVAGSAVATGSSIDWQNLKVNREGQITERFTRAIDQFGASDQEGQPRIEIRLGGIYVPERITKDSGRD